MIMCVRMYVLSLWLENSDQCYYSGYGTQACLFIFLNINAAIVILMYDIEFSIEIEICFVVKKG